MSRHTMIPAVYLVMERDGKIVMLRRFNTGYEDGKYSLPAGHVEDGESIMEACVREAHEETGVSIYTKDIHLVHVMRRYMPDNDRIDFFFESRVWRKRLFNAEPDKCDELIWTNIDKLPENTIPYIIEFIEHYKRGVMFSDYGTDRDLSERIALRQASALRSTTS